MSTLDEKHDHGIIWVTVPAIDIAVGPVWFADYLAHQLGAIPHAELTALADKRTDPARLPECRIPNDLA